MEISILPFVVRSVLTFNKQYFMTSLRAQEVLNSISNVNVPRHHGGYHRSDNGHLRRVMTLINNFDKYPRATAFSCSSWPPEVDLTIFALYLSGATVAECVGAHMLRLKHLLAVQLLEQNSTHESLPEDERNVMKNPSHDKPPGGQPMSDEDDIMSRDDHSTHHGTASSQQHTTDDDTEDPSLMNYDANHTMLRGSRNSRTHSIHESHQPQLFTNKDPQDDFTSKQYSAVSKQSVSILDIAAALHDLYSCPFDMGDLGAVEEDNHHHQVNSDSVVSPVVHAFSQSSTVNMGTLPSNGSIQFRPDSTSGPVENNSIHSQSHGNVYYQVPPRAVLFLKDLLEAAADQIINLHAARNNSKTEKTFTSESNKVTDACWSSWWDPNSRADYYFYLHLIYEHFSEQYRYFNSLYTSFEHPTLFGGLLLAGNAGSNSTPADQALIGAIASTNKKVVTTAVASVNSGVAEAVAASSVADRYLNNHNLIRRAMIALYYFLDMTTILPVMFGMRANTFEDLCREPTTAALLSKIIRKPRKKPTSLGDENSGSEHSDCLRFSSYYDDNNTNTSRSGKKKKNKSGDAERMPEAHDNQDSHAGSEQLKQKASAALVKFAVAAKFVSKLIGRHSEQDSLLVLETDSSEDDAALDHRPCSGRTMKYAAHVIQRHFENIRRVHRLVMNGYDSSTNSTGKKVDSGKSRGASHTESTGYGRSYSVKEVIAENFQLPDEQVTQYACCVFAMEHGMVRGVLGSPSLAAFHDLTLSSRFTLCEALMQLWCDETHIFLSDSFLWGLGQLARVLTEPDVLKELRRVMFADIQVTQSAHGSSSPNGSGTYGGPSAFTGSSPHPIITTDATAKTIGARIDSSIGEGKVFIERIRTSLAQFPSPSPTVPSTSSFTARPTPSAVCSKQGEKPVCTHKDVLGIQRPAPFPDAPDPSKGSPSPMPLSTSPAGSGPASLSYKDFFTENRFSDVVVIFARLCRLMATKRTDICGSIQYLYKSLFLPLVATTGEWHTSSSTVEFPSAAATGGSVTGVPGASSTQAETPNSVLKFAATASSVFGPTGEMYNIASVREMTRFIGTLDQKLPEILELQHLTEKVHGTTNTSNAESTLNESTTHADKILEPGAISPNGHNHNSTQSILLRATIGNASHALFALTKLYLTLLSASYS